MIGCTSVLLAGSLAASGLAPPPRDRGTVALDLTLPAGVRVEDLRVRFDGERPQDGPTSGALLVPAYAPVEAVDGRLLASITDRTLVLDEDESWWRVHVATLDGLWWGTRLVPRPVRGLDDPVEVELRACGAVDLTVTDGSGRVRAPGGDSRIGGTTTVALDLTPLDPGHDVVGLRIDTTLYRRRRVAPVLPGRYRVRVSSNRMRSAELAWEVRAGETLAAVLALEPEPDLVNVSIALGLPAEVEAGMRFDEVVLASTEFDGRTFRVDAGQDCTIYDGLLSPRDDAPGFLHAVVAAVPAGRYRVFARPHGGTCWQGLVDVGPECSLAIPCALDAEEVVALDARDATTGRSIPRAWMAPLSGGSWPAGLVHFGPSERRPGLRRPGDDDLVRFAVTARGYRPVFGDRELLASTPRAEPLVVRMQRGWGARVRALDEADRPVPDVWVRADGELLGRTDASGVLDVALDAPPSRLELIRNRWRAVHGGDIHPETGRYRSTSGLLEARMRPHAR